jgi:hypothetical protein
MRPTKLAFLFTLLLTYLTLNTLYAQQNPDFRTVRWGTTAKEVKEAEVAKLSSRKRDRLIYNQVPLVDRMVGLEYEFNNDSLITASYYYYMRASITKDDVIAASVEFENALTEKYGKGKSSFVGDIRNVVWLTPRTQISLSVGNVDRGWSAEVQYVCRICSAEAAKALANKEFKPLKDVKDF